MKEYEVTWSIYVAADSPEDAARQVKGTLQDPGNEAWVFVVRGLDSENSVVIDMQYTDEPTIYRKVTL